MTVADTNEPGSHSALTANTRLHDATRTRTFIVMKVETLGVIRHIVIMVFVS